MTKHKWHKEIKAWADGEEIEWRYTEGEFRYWQTSSNPSWDAGCTEYRIKPQPKQTEALKMAIDLLESLKTGRENFQQSSIHIVCNECEKALEQLAQEPVMNVTLSCGCKSSELGFPSEWDSETKECEPCTNYGMYGRKFK